MSPLPSPTAHPSAGRSEIALRLIQAAILTPFLAVCRDTLRENLARWQKNLPVVLPHDAVEANIDPLVTGELCRQGTDADVVPVLEMDAVAAVGFPGDRMILSNPRKDWDTIRAMPRTRPWVTTVDSEEEVHKLSDVGIPSAEYRPVPFARIRVPTRGVKQDLSSKFRAGG